VIAVWDKSRETAIRLTAVQTAMLRPLPLRIRSRPFGMSDEGARHLTCAIRDPDGAHV